MSMPNGNGQRLARTTTWKWTGIITAFLAGLSERRWTCGSHKKSLSVSIKGCGLQAIREVRPQVRLTTTREHMPPSHRHYLEQTPENLIASAERIGPDVSIFIKAILDSSKQHLGIRSSLGVLRLVKEYGPERLGGACRRALALQALSSRSVESILKTGLDRAPLPAAASPSPLYHENLRGPHYFN